MAKEEGDHWGIIPDIDPGDLQILQDYKEFASQPRGKRIIEHLKQHLHVGETMTIEEMLCESGNHTPIDVNALLIRTGMRRAWALIDAHIHGLERLEAERAARSKEE